MRHFFFYSSGRLPSPAAHVIQILKTAHALARLDDTRVTVEFLTVRESPDSALARLGLTPIPGIALRGMIPPWIEILARPGASFDTRRHWIWKKTRDRARREWMAARADGFTPVIVTRKLEILELLRPAAVDCGTTLLLEVHWLKQLDHYRRFIMKAGAAGRLPSLSERKSCLRHKQAEERDRMNQADGILCLSGGLDRRIARMGVVTPRFRLPSGTDPIEHRPERPRDLDVLYSGGLQPWKGITTLIRAMGLLPGRNLRIIGGTDPERMMNLRALARECGAEDRIDFAGLLPQTEVADEIRRARIGVIPLPRAGFPEARDFTSPLKLLEYASHGAAIVASDLPSIREMVTHDATAWLVRPDDPHALAGGIRRILDDQALRARLSGHARSMAAANTYANRALRMIEAVERLHNAPPGCGP